MKIDQTKLTSQTHDKLKEVNEVSEIIRIICEAVEENYHVLSKDEEIKFYYNLWCSLENKRAFNNNGMCSACHTCQWDTLKFSENHRAIIF
jgi:hypothetical protein